MRDIKLRPAILIVLILGFLLPVLLVGWLTLIDQKKRLWQSLSDDHDRIVSIIALGIQEPLWSLHADPGLPLVNAMMTDNRITRIFIVSDDGVFIEKSKPFADTSQIQSRSQNVTYHGRPIGEVTIDMDYGHSQHAFTKQVTRYLLIFLIPLSISNIILFLLLRKKVIHPMEELIIQSENLAHQKLDIPFTWKQVDEMGMLGQSLEQTRQSLQSAFRELENLHSEAIEHSKEQERINIQLNKEIKERTSAEERLREHRNLLEKKVAERTAELVEVNENLVQEIEERKRAEEERKRIALRLHRAEKMEALGILASGVAHDLNNILAGVASYPELLLMKIDKSSELYGPLEDIHDAGKRAAAVVADLLTIARSTSSVFADHSLNELVTEYLRSPEFRRLEMNHPHITVEYLAAKDSLSINCSPVHVKKCLMNLVTNSFEAAPPSSTVTISISRETSVTPERKGSYAVLHVKNHGPEISPESLERIFEPFYSTKQLGMSGSGLGLAIVWNTMEEHKGWVSAQSTADETVFSLFFPEHSGKKEELKRGEKENIVGNNERILVVDDEPLLLKIADKMLSNLGYQVFTAGSGEKALEFLSSHTVDAVILDMIMDPGMNGRQTYEKIVEISPQQKAMIVSGFAMNDDIRAALNMGVATFLKKPYSMEELGLSLRYTLDKDL